MDEHPYYSKQERFLRDVLTRFADHHNASLSFPSEPIEPWQIEEFVAKQPRSVVAFVQRSDGKVVAVSRRGRPADLGLPGGKIDPGETPEEAAARELLEETGVVAKKMEFCYERVDRTDGRVAWCYRVVEWEGEPRHQEPSIYVSWEEPLRLLEENCVFREYNRGLFAKLGIV